MTVQNDRIQTKFANLLSPPKANTVGGLIVLLGEIPADVSVGKWGGTTGIQVVVINNEDSAPTEPIVVFQ